MQVPVDGDWCTQFPAVIRSQHTYVSVVRRQPNIFARCQETTIHTSTSTQICKLSGDSHSFIQAYISASCQENAIHMQKHTNLPVVMRQPYCTNEYKHTDLQIVRRQLFINTSIHIGQLLGECHTYKHTFLPIVMRQPYIQAYTSAKCQETAIHTSMHICQLGD